MFRRLAKVAQRTLTRALNETTDAGAGSISYATDPAGAFVPIRGIFQDAHAEQDLESTSGVSTVNPVVSFQIADLPAYPPPAGHRVKVARLQGDPAAVGSQVFKIDDHLPDGEGMVEFILSKA
jgi:hypothetical protein